eukprot:3933745-Prymnesium_polylepis.1
MQRSRTPASELKDAGQCVARALDVLGVFENVQEAVDKLDSASESVLVKRRQELGEGIDETR